MTHSDSKFDRYRRQIRFAPLGEEGQQKLLNSRVLICGCGALGSVVADTLVRAGVGFLRIVDRDFVDLDNLHRQVLFDERDAAEQLPKAVAASRRLEQVNSSVEIEPVVADVHSGNLRQLAVDVDVLIDGTDNFETRYLLNDFAVANGTPWIFGGCVAMEGQAFAIVPGHTPCLTCIIPKPPPAAAQPTCETAGVLAPIVNVVASLQASEAIKLLSGNCSQLNPAMTFVDLWQNELRQLAVDNARNENCPTCGRHEFPWLEGHLGAAVTQLCGRNSVQISPANDDSIDLPALAKKLSSAGQVTMNPYLVRLVVDEFLFTIFADGRTIVTGTDDPSTARTLQAKYIGG